MESERSPALFVSAKPLLSIGVPLEERTPAVAVEHGRRHRVTRLYLDEVSNDIVVCTTSGEVLFASAHPLWRGRPRDHTLNGPSTLMADTSSQHEHPSSIDSTDKVIQDTFPDIALSLMPKLSSSAGVQRPLIAKRCPLPYEASKADGMGASCLVALSFDDNKVYLYCCPMRRITSDDVGRHSAADSCNPLAASATFTCAPKSLRFRDDHYPLQNYYWVVSPNTCETSHLTHRRALLCISTVCVDLLGIQDTPTCKGVPYVLLRRYPTRTDLWAFHPVSCMLVCVNKERADTVKPFQVWPDGFRVLRKLRLPGKRTSEAVASLLDSATRASHAAKEPRMNASPLDRLVGMVVLHYTLLLYHCRLTEGLLVLYHYRYRAGVVGGNTEGNPSTEGEHEGFVRLAALDLCLPAVQLYRQGTTESLPRLVVQVADNMVLVHSIVDGLTCVFDVLLSSSETNATLPKVVVVGQSCLQERSLASTGVSTSTFHGMPSSSSAAVEGCGSPFSECRRAMWPDTASLLVCGDLHRQLEGPPRSAASWLTKIADSVAPHTFGECIYTTDGNAMEDTPVPLLQAVWRGQLFFHGPNHIAAAPTDSTMVPADEAVTRSFEESYAEHSMLPSGHAPLLLSRRDGVVQLVQIDPVAVAGCSLRHASARAEFYLNRFMCCGWAVPRLLCDLLQNDRHRSDSMVEVTRVLDAVAVQHAVRSQRLRHWKALRKGNGGARAGKWIPPFPAWMMPVPVLGYSLSQLFTIAQGTQSSRGCSCETAWIGGSWPTLKRYFCGHRTSGSGCLTICEVLESCLMPPPVHFARKGALGTSLFFDQLSPDVLCASVLEPVVHDALQTMKGEYRTSQHHEHRQHLVFLLHIVLHYAKAVQVTGEAVPERLQQLTCKLSIEAGSVVGSTPSGSLYGRRTSMEVDAAREWHNKHTYRAAEDKFVGALPLACCDGGLQPSTATNIRGRPEALSNLVEIFLEKENPVRAARFLQSMLVLPCSSDSARVHAVLQCAADRVHRCLMALSSLTDGGGCTEECGGKGSANPRKRALTALSACERDYVLSFQLLSQALLQQPALTNRREGNGEPSCIQTLDESHASLPSTLGRTTGNREVDMVVPPRLLHFTRLYSDLLRGGSVTAAARRHQ